MPFYLMPPSGLLSSLVVCPLCHVVFYFRPGGGLHIDCRCSVMSPWQPMLQDVLLFPSSLTIFTLLSEWCRGGGQDWTVWSLCFFWGQRVTWSRVLLVMWRAGCTTPCDVAVEGGMFFLLTAAILLSGMAMGVGNWTGRWVLATHKAFFILHMTSGYY